MGDLATQIFRFNPQAESFIPAAPTSQSSSTTSATTNTTSNSNSIPVDNKSEMLNHFRDRLRQDLELIQRDPEEVHNVSVIILKEYDEKNNLRNDIIHVVLDEVMDLAKSVEAFAYNGARLCCILSEFRELTGNRTVEPDREFFHFDDLLMDRLYNEFTYAKEVSVTGNFQQRIHNFLIFFASLVTQKQMVPLVQREILMFLRELLGNQNYFKTIATVVKIGGAFFDGGEMRWALDSLMRRMIKVARTLPKESLPYRQLYTLVELRAVGWDWDDPVEIQQLNIGKPVENHAPNGYEQIAPYNSAAFGFGQNEMDEFVRQDEIDEEAAEAFEQFLLQTGQLN